MTNFIGCHTGSMLSLRSAHGMLNTVNNHPLHWQHQPTRYKQLGTVRRLRHWRRRCMHAIGK